MAQNKKIPVTFPGIDVVEASAGSGKTYALAKRFIQIIMYPGMEEIEDPLRSILAITFTNKATVEMKRRIVGFLKMIALDSFKDKNIEKDIFASLEIDRKSAREKASLVMQGIIDRYDAFQVQTIDSFVNTIISGSSFRLGLSASSRVMDDHRDYLEFSLDKVIDKAMSDKNIYGIFERFLDYYLFVENKDGWFSKKDILKLIGALFGYSTSYPGSFVPAGKSSSIRSRKKKIIDTIKWIHGSLPEGTDGRFVSSLEKFLRATDNSFNLSDISAYFRRESLPARKNTIIPRETERKWDNLRNLLRKLAEEEAYAVFSPYINIFNLVMGEFRSSAKEDNIVFLQELNDLASSVMQEDNCEVPEIYYRITARIRNFLIDEFQDTSTLQWHNLRPMVEEALSSGGTMFYVGDKKQAIFRFRGGNVGLFDDIYRSFGGFQPRRSFLNTNYRSRKHIVDFNNRIFSCDNIGRFLDKIDEKLGKDMLLDRENREKIFSVFPGSDQESLTGLSGGYVNVEKVYAEDAEQVEEAVRSKLSERLKEISARVPYGDIAILARSNSDIKLLTSWLIEENIPVVSERTLDVKENHMIKEIISFLSFLSSPIDDIAFAGFIQGDIFCKVTGWDKDISRDFLFRQRSVSRDKGEALYVRFRREYRDIWEDLVEDFFKSVGFVPIYELVISVYKKFSVMSNFPEYHGFLAKFLEIIKDKEEDASGMHDLLEKLDKLEDKERYVDLPGKNAVKILTIHKSKGLEFPVVVLPLLTMDIGVGTGIGSWRKPYVIGPGHPDKIDILQLRKKCVLFSEALTKKYVDEYTSSVIDELDNVYVAFTRAEDELHVFVPPRAGRSVNPAGFLLGDDREEKGVRPRKSRPKKAVPDNIRIIPPSAYSDWISFLKEETVGVSELLNREEILRGDICHYMLSLLTETGVGDKQVFINKCLERSWYYFDHADDRMLAQCANMVERLISSDDLRHIFYPEGYEVHNEREIIDANGITKRIDRLMVSAREILIVDYKSSGEGSEGHKEQVRGYKDILKDIYRGHEIKGILVYMDTGKAVEV